MSEHTKIRTRNDSVFGHFSRSASQEHILIFSDLRVLLFTEASFLFTVCRYFLGLLATTFFQKVLWERLKVRILIISLQFFKIIFF